MSERLRDPLNRAMLCMAVALACRFMPRDVPVRVAEQCLAWLAVGFTLLSFRS